MFNENPYYRNYRYSNYYRYNNSFIPTYYPNKDYKVESEKHSDSSIQNPAEEDQETYVKKEEKKEEVPKNDFDSSSKKQFRLGPFSINDNSINLFGFNIAIDDLIIIGLIILLLFQSETDYIIIIILGLILLNIDFSSLNLF